MIIATCGHETKEINSIAVKDTVVDHTQEKIVNCVAHLVVCKDCKESYEKDNLILRSEEEINNYLITS